MSDDIHVSILYYEVNEFTIQTRIVDTLCCILVILGLIGNVLGLFIFSLSRRTWRISSIYAFLATASAITNLLCVIRYAALLHSTSRNILHRLVGQIPWICKFYEFTFSFRIISSWITVFWMFERLTCVSRRLRIITNRCNSPIFKFILPIIIIITILISAIGPPVYMYQPQLISNNGLMNSTKNMMYCKLNINASVIWQRYFRDVEIGINHFTIRCLFSELIPTAVIILFNSYIIYYIIRTCRCLNRRHGHQPGRKQSRTTSWVNIILIIHSLLFLSSLLSHIVGHFIVVEAHETWWVLLAVLINSSLNFYIYCLSGKAFRNEIRRIVRRLKTRLFNTTQLRQQQQSYQNQRLIYEFSNFQDNPIKRRFL